jgi:3-hydroxyisobutyrate dehydrogenase-like beta-hydroxyacid dehydrogenase
MNRQKMSIGFIGLGRMGTPMAQNLLKAGYSLKVYDIIPEKITPLVALGAHMANSPANAVVETKLVISMILDDANLETVALGADGILAAARPGLIYADMSTVSPMASQRVAIEAEQREVKYLRAKVSGSIKPATDGTLTIFASGPEDAYKQCLDVFAAMGSSYYYVGTSEEAIYLKLVLSIIVGLTTAMISEALTFGQRGEVDWHQMIDVINNSPLNSAFFDYKVPLLKSRNYTNPQSTIDVAAKDVDLALAAGKQLNIPMPITALARELMRSMQARDKGSLDLIGLVTLMEELAGIKPAES